MKHYDSVHKTSNNQIRASEGVTIYTKHFLEAEEIPLITDYEAIAVILSIPQKICICNIYIPPDAESNINDLDNLIGQLPKPCVILGDFNAHNTIWGCLSTNPSGSKLLETFINTSNLVLLNSGEITRINTATGNYSALDLALCHPNVSSTLTWTVLPDPYGSDHFPIILGADVQDTRPTFRPSWRLKNVIDNDWTRYGTLLEAQIPNEIPNPVQDIDMLVDELTESIVQSAIVVIGKITQCVKKIQGNKESETTITLKDEGITIQDNSLIAEKFYDYFTNIGAQLAEKIKKTDKKHRAKIIDHSIYLSEVEEDEVMRVITN
ncbi:hypothetical protein JTB14_038347 [Gonioctena quinquepunctata]|nr:hypothetical protein JTB14_038347 [Gonioctena quinquepunctata]